MKVLLTLTIVSWLSGQRAECGTTVAASGGNRCSDAALFHCNSTISGGFCMIVTKKITLPPLNITDGLFVAPGQYTVFPSLLEPQTGPRCWTDSVGFQCCSNPCEPNPCQNGGTCINGTEFTSFSCECPLSVNGSYCENDNRCDKCHKNAICKNSICECKPGFQGDGESCTAECAKILIKESDALTKCGFTSVTFQTQVGGLTQKSVESCDNGRNYAEIECKLAKDKSAWFDNRTLTCVSCNETLSTVTGEKVQENITVKEVEDKLATLQVLSNEPGTSQEDVKDTTNYLKDLSTALDTKTNEEEPKKIGEQSMKAVLEIVENLGSVLVPAEAPTSSGGGKDEENKPSGDKEEIRKSTREATEIIDSFARKVDLGNKTEVEITTKTMTLKIDKPVIDEEKGFQPLTIKPASYVENPTKKTGSKEVSTTRTNVVRIAIPASAIEKLNQLARSANALPLTLVTVLYSDVSLITEPNAKRPTSQLVQMNFKPGQTTEETDLGGQTFKIEFDDKPEPAPSQLIIEPDSLKKLRREFFCVYYDFTANKWDNKGCSFISGPQPYCECVHLTCFALLLRATEVLEDYDFNSASEIYSLVASGLSVFCLAATIVIYLVVRELRIRRPTPILVNICLSLAIAYVIFIVGMNGRARGFSDPACYFSAVLMHVAFLCSWFWMLIYSLNMYLALVKVVKTDSFARRKLFMYTFGYGIPVVLVATNLAVATYLDNLPRSVDAVDLESRYIASHICWVRNLSLYYGFALPVGVILLLNFVFFFVIIRKLTWKRAEIQSTKEAITVKQQVFMAVTMVAMMGLSWVFGYIMLISPDEGLQRAMTIVFDVLNTAQGLVIFWVSCMRQKAVRQLWLVPILNRFNFAGFRKPKQSFLDSERTNTTSSGTFSSKNADMSITKM